MCQRSSELLFFITIPNSLSSFSIQFHPETAFLSHEILLSGRAFLQLTTFRVTFDLGIKVKAYSLSDVKRLAVIMVIIPHFISEDKWLITGA